MSVGIGTAAMGSYGRGGRDELNSEYSRGKWEFRAKEQGGGQCVEDTSGC